jgi:hypothetical protein
MRHWLLSTTGLLALVLVCPRVTRAQAEELPPAAVDNVPAPAAPQATTPPMAAPPAAAPSPQAPPSAAVARDHGWMLIPYLGLNLPVAAAAKSYSAGFRLGGLAGWSLTPRFSINGEITLDLMDGDADSSMLKPHEHYLDFVLSPLLHFRSGNIVVGPKLGWFTNSRSFSDSDSAPLREWMFVHGSRSGYSGPMLEAHSGQGFLFGINAGGFIPAGKLAIGLLAGASFRHFTTVDCGPYGCTGDYGMVTVMSLSVAALF